MIYNERVNTRFSALRKQYIYSELENVVGLVFLSPPNSFIVNAPHHVTLDNTPLTA